MLVYGEPGIGKTRLLELAAAAAADFKVLRAHPLEADSALAFAGLFELLHSRSCTRSAGFPGPRRPRFPVRSPSGRPAPGDRFAVTAATLSLLAAAAEESPVLVVVDDAPIVPTFGLCRPLTRHASHYGRFLLATSAQSSPGTRLHSAGSGQFRAQDFLAVACCSATRLEWKPWYG